MSCFLKVIKSFTHSRPTIHILQEANLNFGIHWNHKLLRQNDVNAAGNFGLMRAEKWSAPGPGPQGPVSHRSVFFCCVQSEGKGNWSLCRQVVPCSLAAAVVQKNSSLQDFSPTRTIICSYTVHAMAAIMVLLRARGTAPLKKPWSPCSI